MAKFSLKNSLAASRADENGLRWYECAEYGEVKEYIKGNLQKIQENFVAVGYWLKYVKDNKMYVEDGYKSIEEFAQVVYQISKSTTYRLMEINTNFSKNGNSPELAEEYKDFSKSQLQELLTLTDSQREEVTPEMTIDEIRQVKKENQPDDGMIRTFTQEMLRGDIEKQDYADAKSLKDYLYNHFGKSYDGCCSNELDYRSDPKGIIFNHLSTTPNDKITWLALAKRIIELYKNDPLILELPEVLDGQMEIVNVDMEVKEYNYRQDALSEPKEELQCKKVTPEAERDFWGSKAEKKVYKILKEAVEAVKEPEEEQDSVQLQENTCNEENEKPYQRGCITGASPYGVCSCCGAEGVTDVDFEPFDEEVLPILSYTRGNLTDSIPFMNEQDLFIFGDGHKYAALTMKLQKYIAEQINVLDLDKYRVEIRAVKIK